MEVIASWGLGVVAGRGLGRARVMGGFLGVPLARGKFSEGIRIWAIRVIRMTGLGILEEISEKMPMHVTLTTMKRNMLIINRLDLFIVLIP